MQNKRACGSPVAESLGAGHIKIVSVRQTLYCVVFYSWGCILAIRGSQQIFQREVTYDKTEVQ